MPVCVDSGVAVGTVVSSGVWSGVAMTVGSAVGVVVATTLGLGVGVEVEDLLLHPTVPAAIVIATTSIQAIRAILAVLFIQFRR